MLLYTRNVSNYCFKTEWALYELNIPFDREPNQGDRDLLGMGKLAKATPNLVTIPTLVDDNGFTVTESSVIIQYLVDTRKINSSFFPKDPDARARVLQWDRFGDFEVAKALGAFYYNSPDYLQGAAPNASEVELAAKEVPIIEKKLNAVLAKQRYITSDKDFTYADVTLAANVFFLQWFNQKMTSPGVVRWLTECTSRPAFTKRMALISP